MSWVSAVPHPIEGQVVLLVGAKASVTLQRLSDLLHSVQEHLDGEAEDYHRRYEQIDTADERVYFLVADDYWEIVGGELSLTEREVDAVRRAHEAQFERDGRHLDRIEEFESALEIRDVVVLPAN